MNWGHRNFQSRALPTELSRQKQMANGAPPTARHCAVCQVPSAIYSERAMRFELTTFSLARKRSTTELRPQNAIHRTGLCTMIARWTRSDSNRRSPPCKGGAFPLGHGPDCLPTGGQCRREDSNLHALRATDPKSAASANSATSACVDGGLRTGWWYSRFC